MNLVFANDIYRILQIEFYVSRRRSRTEGQGPQRSLQAVDRLGTAVREYGRPARSVRTAEELSQALGESLAEAGPRLIEVRTS